MFGPLLLGDVSAPQQLALSEHLNFQKFPENGRLLTFLLPTALGATMTCTVEHLNCQKCSDAEVLFTFWFSHVIGATTTSKFSFLISPDGCAPAALANLLPDPSGTTKHWKTGLPPDLLLHLFLVSSDAFPFLISFVFLFFSLALPTLFPLMLAHLSILSEIWLLNFLGPHPTYQPWKEIILHHSNARGIPVIIYGWDGGYGMVIYHINLMVSYLISYPNSSPHSFHKSHSIVGIHIQVNPTHLIGTSLEWWWGRGIIKPSTDWCMLIPLYYQSSCSSHYFDNPQVNLLHLHIQLKWLCSLLYRHHPQW